MSAPTSGASETTLDKETYTGVAGGRCRYSGSAKSGLRIELALTDVLTVTAEQIRTIFAALGTHNPLLEECRGYRPSPEPVAARALRWARSVGSTLRSQRTSPGAHLVSPRFVGWLAENAHAQFGRPLDAEHALCIQAVFAGEGLLGRDLHGIEDFQTAGVVEAARALIGRPLIYEERRTFSAVVLEQVETSGDEPESIHLGLRNLFRPGFEGHFPGSFSAGGLVAETHLGVGTMSGYMGLYTLITGPASVVYLMDLAKGSATTDQFRNTCRNIIRSSARHVY